MCVDEIKTLSVSEAAEKLNISRTFLYKLMNNKEVPFRQLGTRKFFMPEDIESIIVKSLHPAS